MREVCERKESEREEKGGRNMNKIKIIIIIINEVRKKKKKIVIE